VSVFDPPSECNVSPGFSDEQEPGNGWYMLAMGHGGFAIRRTGAEEVDRDEQMEAHWL
jgi:hypothetical protein